MRGLSGVTLRSAGPARIEARPTRPQLLWHSTYSTRTSPPVVPLWIDGQAVTSTQHPTTKVRHSKKKSPSCDVVVAGREETDAAVEASWRAFGKWKAISGWERRKILAKVLSLLEERFQDLAGAVRADADFSDVLMGADRSSALNITDGAAVTAVSTEGWIPQTTEGNLAMVTREPYGPTLSIPAFNFPLTLALRSIVYPIACGNTVILKSSVLIPQVHGMLAPLFEDAGLPKGVLQVLNFSETDVVDRIEQLIAHPKIRMINFTGSTKTGRVIAKTCAEHLKPSVLELGGKAAVIVLPSADLKIAANNVLFGALVNSGQICMSTERVLVHSDVADAFEAQLLAAAKALEQRQGGFELVRLGAVKEAAALVRDAVDNGARLVYPSSPSAAPSSTETTTFAPHILADIKPTARLYSGEAFAPILSLSRFSSSSEALEQVHALPLGLSTSIFGSLDDALPLAREVESGAVHLNGMTVHDQHGLPFGGVKESGWGRFNGRGAIESFTWTKNITVNHPHELPLQAL